MKKLKSLLPWIALFVSISSAYFSWLGINVANESNKIAKDVKETTEKLFLVEKRPYINVYIPEVSLGSYLDIVDGDWITASFKIELRNEGGIPARNIKPTIYYFEDLHSSYEQLDFDISDTQKIFPKESHFIGVSTSGGENSPKDQAIRLKELKFQVVVNYSSDVDGSIIYTTKKQFSVKPEKVILIGNLGEFQ